MSDDPRSVYKQLQEILEECEDDAAAHRAHAFAGNVVRRLEERLAEALPELDRVAAVAAVQSKELTRWRAMFSSPEVCSREIGLLRERVAETEKDRVILERKLGEEKEECADYRKRALSVEARAEAAEREHQHSRKQVQHYSAKLAAAESKLARVQTELKGIGDTAAYVKRFGKPREGAAVAQALEAAIKLLTEALSPTAPAPAVEGLGVLCAKCSQRSVEVWHGGECPFILDRIADGIGDFAERIDLKLREPSPEPAPKGESAGHEAEQLAASMTAALGLDHIVSGHGPIADLARGDAEGPLLDEAWDYAQQTLAAHKEQDWTEAIHCAGHVWYALKRLREQSDERTLSEEMIDAGIPHSPTRHRVRAWADRVAVLEDSAASNRELTRKALQLTEWERELAERAKPPAPAVSQGLEALAAQWECEADTLSSAGFGSDRIFEGDINELRRCAKRLRDQLATYPGEHPSEPDVETLRAQVEYWRIAAQRTSEGLEARLRRVLDGWWLARGGRDGKGMRVPYHGELAAMPPSCVKDLERMLLERAQVEGER